MIAHHLPALQIVLPLMAAPVCVLIRRGLGAWSLAMVVSILSLIISLAILFQVMETGVIRYALGDWAAPWGIEYRIDLINAFVMVIVSGIAAVVGVFAKASVEKEIPQDRHYLFYTAYLLCLTGLLGIAITGDVFNLFVFLEVSSLSTYMLISLARDRRALTAAYRYLILGTIGATFYVIGIGLLYMMTGTLNMADLAEKLPAVQGTTTILAALAFLTIGLSLKAAVFPLHQWLPNAYAYAPSVVTAFVAATATKVSVYVFLRIFFTVFGGTTLLTSFPLADIIMVLALVAMFAGSASAIFQSNVKKLFAYSSVAQIGYMMLGISLLSVTGLSAGIIHLFNHALMKCAIFLALGCVFWQIGSVKLGDMAGIGKRMPWTMGAFVAGGLSLIGVPPTVGFISKWVLVTAALEQGRWEIAVLILLSSLLAVIYIWRVIEVAYFRPEGAGAIKVSEAPMSMLVPLWIMAGAAFWFGIDGTGTLAVAENAAKLLIGGAP
ncbi:monovalent cation/H+ antiporter subunit D family protein [Magnetospira sp. QH-2]|uniref:monovalent cation/H+ antiporter subunit D family protein n=1 Tax=Magnetospira sp. (strain QH-2) TaxID=1288970 RepID=UPI0003E818F3|nr:monovalent cation/H+ antiporter subunit D family protein [Magnetospira sp. QH-2]CCQ73458.1 NADH dehydrogenase/oxidoreductase [Magnetospira sp. QH-2]